MKTVIDKQPVIIVNCTAKDKTALRTIAGANNKTMTEYLIKLIHYANDRKLKLN